MPWTEITRPDYDRRGLRYASDCTDDEWAVVAPFLLPASRVGRPRKHSMRRMWDAISYIAATVANGRCCRRIFRLSQACNITSTAFVIVVCWM